MDWCTRPKYSTNRQKIPRCALGPQRGIAMNKGRSRMCDGCCDGRQDGANKVHYIAPLGFSVIHRIMSLMQKELQM